MSHRDLLIRAGWAPVAVVAVHGAWANVFGHPPWLDLLMHPLGGLAIAHAFDVAYRRLPGLVGRPTPLGHSLLVLGSAALVALGWEIVEFLSDELLGTAVQTSVRETMLDLVLGTGAAAFAVGISAVSRNAGPDPEPASGRLQ